MTRGEPVAGGVIVKYFMQGIPFFTSFLAADARMAFASQTMGGQAYHEYPLAFSLSVPGDSSSDRMDNGDACESPRRRGNAGR